MKTKATLGAIALLVGIALGAVSGVWIERRSTEERMAAAVGVETARAESLAAELSELRDLGALRELHLRLGRVAIEADRQDYGTAGERAARLFDDLDRLDSEMPEGDPARPALRHVLAARDDIVAGLATARPEAAERLAELYLELFSMIRPPARSETEVAHQTSSQPTVRRRAGRGRRVGGGR